MQPFQATLHEGLRHGMLVGVQLPAGKVPVPADVLARLHPQERALAEGMTGYRQVRFVGGRLAAQEAQRALDGRTGPILIGPRGEPVPPSRFSISISHTDRDAVALLGFARHGALGVDLQAIHPARPAIASRILTPAELAQVDSLPPARRWVGTLMRFSFKEAIYKALAPRLGRYIAFEEAEVAPGRNGQATVSLHLTDGPEPAAIEPRYRWIGDDILCTVRARWG